MDFSKICVVSAEKIEGFTVYHKLPAEGQWEAYAFAAADCAAEDLRACAENTLRTGHATLGVRPKRGLLNKVTGLFYRFFGGLKLMDSDPAVIVLPHKPKTARFKADLLLDIKKSGAEFDQLPISQTKPGGFWKTVGTWFLLLRHFIAYGLNAVFSAVLEEGLLALFGRLFLGLLTGFAFTAATAGLARLISSLCNFFINKKLVFSSNTGTFKALLRYYAVAIPNGLLQIGLFHGACLLFGISEEQTLVRGILHFGVMVLLFCVTFVVQQRWVFKKD